MKGERRHSTHPRSISHIEKLREGLAFPKTFFDNKKEIASKKCI